jgi:hypothetical protein
MSGELVATSARILDRGNDVSRVFTACVDTSNALFASPAAVERDVCQLFVAGEPDLLNGATCSVLTPRRPDGPRFASSMARRTQPARRRSGSRSPSES